MRSYANSELIWRGNRLALKGRASPAVEIVQHEQRPTAIVTIACVAQALLGQRPGMRSAVGTGEGCGDVRQIRDSPFRPLLGDERVGRRACHLNRFVEALRLQDASRQDDRPEPATLRSAQRPAHGHARSA